MKKHLLAYGLLLIFIALFTTACDTPEPETIIEYVDREVEVEVEVEVEIINPTPVILSGQVGTEGVVSGETDSVTYTFTFDEPTEFKIEFTGDQNHITFNFNGTVYIVDQTRTFEFDDLEGDYFVTISEDGYMPLNYELALWVFVETNVD